MIVDILRRRPRARGAFGSLKREVRRLDVTPHILYELYRGVAASPSPRRERHVIEGLGEWFRLLPFDRPVATAAGGIAAYLAGEGRRPPDVDLFIAASAIVWGDGEILTLDDRDFRRFKPFGLRVSRYSR